MTCIKSFCDFDQINDVTRCTVVVTTLAGVAAVVGALLTSPDVIVVRMKNRFKPSYNSAPRGRYLDCQLLVLIKVDGEFVFAEIQANLASMMAIKGRPGGRSLIFKFARSIEVFDRDAYTHSGEWSAQICARIAAGSLLIVDMRNGGVGSDGQQVATTSSALSEMLGLAPDPDGDQVHVDTSTGGTLLDQIN